MDYLFLSRTTLFRGITPEEIQTMMGCLQGITKEYPRGSIIHHFGECISTLGLVLSGSVSVENDDIWGNKTILDKIGVGNTFAENYACLPGEPLMVNIVAAEAAEILFLNTEYMLRVCSRTCGFHNRLIHNMLTISAQKNLNLSRRSLHTGPKTIRGRLLSYLSHLAVHHGSREFDIPFNRQQLADYLNVDRSAMSNELSKMQKEGQIISERNHFRILNMEVH